MARIRVRGDEILPTDRLVIRVVGRGQQVHPIASLDTERTERGQRRIRVKVEGFPPMSYAPHSKHTVVRTREA